MEPTPLPPSDRSRAEPPPLSDADESLLAQFVDELTARLQRGEEPDPDSLIRRHPGLADELRSLWATVWVAEVLAREDRVEPPAGEMTGSGSVGLTLATARWPMSTEDSRA